MSGTIPTVNPDPNVVAQVMSQIRSPYRAIVQLNFCINLQRSSSAVKIELSVPTWATAILFLFSPFLGSIRTQFYAKLFILLLQFLTLQLFSNRIAPHLGSAAATPVISRYSFALPLEPTGFSGDPRARHRTQHD